MQPRLGNPLIGYSVFIAGTCTACHLLLQTTALHYMSAPISAAAKTQTGHSRVEGWLRRQTMAEHNKRTVALKVATPSAVQQPSPAPALDVARALVMAAAIDDAEYVAEPANAAPAMTPAIMPLTGDREAGARPLHRRNRVPSCHELPCTKNLTAAHQTTEVQARLEPAAKIYRVRTAGQPAGKGPRIAKAAGAKLSAALASKRNKGAAKNSAASTFAYQARLKSEKKIALRRFRETPAEISYRSFVGTFVPAI